MTTKEVRILKKFCEEPQLLGEPPEEYGGYISSTDAAQGHGAWLEDVYGSVNVDPHEVIAVCFGKTRLLEYMSILDSKFGNDWKGLRLYFMKSINYVEPEGTPNRHARAHHDVVVIPFGVTGGSTTGDLIDIRPAVKPGSSPLDHTGTLKKTTYADGDVLNTSKPCPSYCSS